MTDDQIDLNDITDVTQLKALAYDRIISLEMVQTELRAINDRIRELTVSSNGALATADIGNADIS